MRQAAFGFVAGVVLVHQTPLLPPAWALWLLLAPAAVLLRRLPALAALLLGAAWSLHHATTALEHRLPPSLEGRDLWVEGRISDIPSRDSLRTSFILAPDALEGVAPERRPRRLRLSWYQEAPGLAAGERWRLRVRLKRPYGLRNPGGFDYERWLFQRAVDGVGYVRDGEQAQRLAPPSGLHYLRQRLSQRLADLLPTHPQQGVLLALAVGDRRQLPQEQWDLLADTGTSHLLAISGLHVGLVFGFVYAMLRWLWRRSARLCAALPAPQAAAAAGLAAACGYAALAGFTLPTQRAVVMLSVVALCLGLRRRLSRIDALLLAAVAVVLWDPFAPLGPGFWLSFLAVAVILIATARDAIQRPGRLRLQLLVSFGLMPVVGLWFGQLPWASPLANLVAIPVVSLAVVPLDLLAVVLSGALPQVAAVLLQLAATVLDGLFSVLRWLQGPGALQIPALPLPLILLAALGAALLVAPRGLPGRWLAVPLLALLVAYRPPRPAEGEAWVTVLDVGQGLAVAVETRRRVLIYDTGPRLGARLDAGRAAVVPFLRARGWPRLDRLVISHGDSDHAGGAASVADELEIGAVDYGEPVPGLAGHYCRAGRAWRWDGVRFDYLAGGRGRRDGNASSCVLRVRAGGATALLTGDLEAAGEERLLAEGQRLRAELLVAPHHGSASSSSPAFVAAVAPQAVVYAVGYRNRWDFPRPEVVARYRALGARGYRTAETGALRFRLAAGGDGVRISPRRYFHR